MTCQLIPIESNQLFRPIRKGVDAMTEQAMNDLPVTDTHVMRKELWDRQGANIASR